MPNDSASDVWDIVKGIVLLFLLHGVALFLVLGGLTAILYAVWQCGSPNSGQCGLVITIFVALVGGNFGFWQLLYTLPLIIWLKLRGNIGMMKGVIIGEVITILLSGACFLAVSNFVS
ncbi:MAG: hypothetical protein AAGE59_00825 [Cyanobacteria bacterium P01_F01_bin.86]